MRRHPIIISLISFAVCAVFALGRSWGDDGNPADFGPLPPVPQPPNVVTLSPAEQLGKNIFFDSTLSNPSGYACATCHDPAMGFTGSNSAVNQALGTMPGVVPGRFQSRKPQAVSYAAFSPRGPFYASTLQIWLGGNFWDGRASNLDEQARMPLVGANEMANTPTGPYPPHAGGFSSMVAQKLRNRPYSGLFNQVFGPGELANPDAVLFADAGLVIADYERSAEVNRFSSKYDASKYAVPPRNGYTLSRSEENGMNLFFGKAQCSACHSSATLEIVQDFSGGKDTFSMYCYANIGVPKNPGNPYYVQTNTATNPFGANPNGYNFIDYGLASNPNPTPDGSRFMIAEAGDLAPFRGLFKAPSLRNSDKRPSAGFVKAYMHNGVFKSLEDVVHFYNTRNIAVNKYGHQISYDLRVGPPAGYNRFFTPPEVLDNVQNVVGASPANAGTDVSNNGQVGNLGLSISQENDLVNFLKILTDQ